MMKKLPCPICESVQPVTCLGKYKNKNTMFENKLLFQCRTCSLVFIDPMPSATALDWYYKNCWSQDEVINSATQTSKLTLKIQAEERLKALERQVDVKENFKFLDIGGGKGYLYDQLKNRGGELIFFATELCPEDLKELQKKGIHAFARLEDIPENNFDVVFINCVLEHVSDPLPFMSEILRHTKIGGYLFIEVPDRDDTFKDLLEPHVLIFSSNSLKKLSEKLGLQIVSNVGIGKKRAEVVKERSLSFRLMRKFSSMLARTTQPVNCDQLSEKEIYRLYKFNEEGPGRWWMRIILRKIH